MEGGGVHGGSGGHDEDGGSSDGDDDLFGEGPSDGMDIG